MFFTEWQFFVGVPVLPQVGCTHVHTERNAKVAPRVRCARSPHKHVGALHLSRQRSSPPVFPGTQESVKNIQCSWHSKTLSQVNTCTRTLILWFTRNKLHPGELKMRHYRLECIHARSDLGGRVQLHFMHSYLAAWLKASNHPRPRLQHSTRTYSSKHTARCNRKA